MSTQNSEEWRPLAGFEGVYSVGSLGHIRRDETGKIRVGGGAGWRSEYLGLRIQSNGVGRSMMIHVEVARAFLGPRPAGASINHIDGNKHNNAASNLEYVSNKKNHEHAAELGLHAWGEGHGLHKLTAEQVRAIRADDTWSLRKMAAKYGTSNSNILSIRNRKTWRHLP